MFVSPGQKRTGWNVLGPQRWGSYLKISDKPISKQRKPVSWGKHNRKRSRERNINERLHSHRKTSLPVSCIIPEAWQYWVSCLRLLWTRLLITNWPLYALNQVGLLCNEKNSRALVRSLCFHMNVLQLVDSENHTHSMVLSSAQLLPCRPSHSDKNSYSVRGPGWSSSSIILTDLELVPDVFETWQFLL